MNRSQMKAQKKTQQKKVAKKAVKKVTKRTLTTKKQTTKKAPAQFNAPAFAPSFAAMSAPKNVARLTTLSRRFIVGQMFFSKDHEYIKYDSENTAFVGISNHAQDALGEIVYVEMVEELNLKQKDVIASIESVKSSNSVYAPVDLTVLKVNDALKSQPELINQDPHGEGWMAHVQITNPGHHPDLMTEAEYSAFCV